MFTSPELVAMIQQERERSIANLGLHSAPTGFDFVSSGPDRGDDFVRTEMRPGTERQGVAGLYASACAGSIDRKRTQRLPISNSPFALTSGPRWVHSGRNSLPRKEASVETPPG